MARGIVVEDVVVQGERQIEVARMDGQEVDAEAWRDKLVTEYGVEREVIRSMGYWDPDVPRMHVRTFRWWIPTLPFREIHPERKQSPSEKAPMERV